MLGPVLRCLLLLLLVTSACDEPPIPTPAPVVEPTLPPDDELLASRPFTVIEPPDVDAGTPLPLLVALHGYGNSGSGLDRQFRLTQLAATRGALLVLPSGVTDATGSKGWHAQYAIAKYPFDREYLRALVLKVMNTRAVDPARVYFFGYSQGAHMAHRMACDSADLVAAVVSVAGQAPLTSCAPSRPVSVLQVHGTDDEAISYLGAPSRGIQSAHDTINLWGRLDGCGALENTSRTLDLSDLIDGRETTVEAFATCPAGISVELWTMHEVPHWPSPKPNFASQLYGFLDRNPRP